VKARAAVIVVAALILGLAACSSGPRPPEDPRITVVATTTVLADLVGQVGGPLVRAESLVPANSDVHTFEPRPSDLRRLAGARLIVMNGLGLDDWLDRTVANAAASGTPIIDLGVDLPGVDYIAVTEPGQPANPHLWLYVPYAALYVDRIEAALSRLDPANGPTYAAQAAAYRERLATLDAEVRARIGAIPAEKRGIVLFHDAFPYYARGYGLTIVGVAVPAPGQDPSAAWTGRLVDAIRASGVRAIFSEAQFPARVAQQLAAETGVEVVADLYDDALGDPPVTSYEALVRWDTDAIVKALQR
jgi:ABC-type Zn uptake system ZnuABC Zn-binding protein ZnuA